MATVSSGSRRIESAELHQRIRRAAAGLQSLGLGPGAGVAFCLRNDIEFFEVSLGAGTLGAYAIPINWHLSADEARYILEDSGASVFVVHADLLSTLRPAVPEGVTVLVVPTSPALMAAYGIDKEDAAVPAGETNWSEWLAGFDPRPQAPAQAPPLAVFYTSGTTGRPKGVRRPPFTASQSAAVARVLTLDYGLELDDPEDIVTAVVGPIYHGAPNAHALTCFRAGTSVVVMPRFDPGELLRAIEQERITHLNLVPIMFARLLKLPEEVRHKYDLSSLRYVAHAAAPCPPDIKRAMIEWWGPIICEYYGTTENGNVSFCTSEEWLAHPGTVGKAAAGAEIRILDKACQVLGPGEIGEVALRNTGIGDFHYHNDDAKRRSVERDGFVASGDIGYLDEDGFLFLRDRKVDMIISGGVNIYPAEVEAALADMPGLADSAVFGIPDDEYGERVHAVIQRQPSSPDLSAETVLDFLRTRIAGYKVPRSIEFADQLPREASGKLFKRKLRAPYWEGAGRSI